LKPAAAGGSNELHVHHSSDHNNLSPLPLLLLSLRCSYPTILVTAGLNDPRVGYWCVAMANWQ
jgi:hypothetical protein